MRDFEVSTLNEVGLVFAELLGCIHQHIFDAFKLLEWCDSNKESVRPEFTRT